MKKKKYISQSELKEKLLADFLFTIPADVYERLEKRKKETMEATGATSDEAIFILIDGDATDALSKAIAEERYEDAALIRDGLFEIFKPLPEPATNIERWSELCSIVFGFPIDEIKKLPLPQFKQLVGECTEYFATVKMYDVISNEKLMQFLKRNNLI